MSLGSGPTFPPMKFGGGGSSARTDLSVRFPSRLRAGSRAAAAASTGNNRRVRTRMRRSAVGREPPYEPGTKHQILTISNRDRPSRALVGPYRCRNLAAKQLNLTRGMNIRRLRHTSFSRTSGQNVSKFCRCKCFIGQLGELTALCCLRQS